MADASVNLDDEVDRDSALGDDMDSLSDTSSLASTILRHREDLGRTYHKFNSDQTQYWGPNDERQNNQLDIGHHMMTLLLEDRLTLAPIGDDCHKVIDLGCGTGIWSIDFADSHPEAEVIGVDLSPIQPHWVPPNCRFIIDDVTEPWTYEDNSFDFVHLRCLLGSVKDWPGLYQQILMKMRPGAWIQHLEMSIEFTSDDGTVDDNHIMSQWSKTFLKFGECTGQSLIIADTSYDLIREAGFTNVQLKKYKLPVGTWPKDPKLKEIGFWNYHYCMEGCEGWALYPLLKVFGWSMEEAQAYIAQFRNELKNKGNHTYYRVTLVLAQKPETQTTSTE